MSPLIEWVLEGLVMLAVAAGLGRVATAPGLWVELKQRPARLVILGLLWVGGLAATLYVAISSDQGRRWVVAAGALGLGFATWRARPSYGRRRGLPPGSLGIHDSFRALIDRDYYRHYFGDYGPIFKTSQYGQPVICVLGIERGSQLLLKCGRHLEGATLPYARLVPKGVLRYLSGQDHRELGGVMRTGIAASDLTSAEASVRRIFRNAFTELARESEASSTPGVCPRETIRDAIDLAIARVYLGLEPDQPERVQIRELAQTLDFFRSGGAAWRRKIDAGLAEVSRILEHASRSKPGISAGSALDRILETRPDALAEPALSANLVLIYLMARGDVAGFSVWVFKMLSDHPEWLDRLRGAGRTEGAPARPNDLGSRIVTETLRMEQSEFLYRRAAEDFEFEGFKIPKGWLLRLCVHESHRDPAVFERPDEFNPDRFEAQSFDRSQFAPLGLDAHGCMGNAMIWFLGRILVEELAMGFSWEVVEDGPVEMGSRHWHHWRPNLALRVKFRRRVNGPAPTDS